LYGGHLFERYYVVHRALLLFGNNTPQARFLGDIPAQKFIIGQNTPLHIGRVDNWWARLLSNLWVKVCQTLQTMWGDY
jgi:hypothetical protein